MQSSIEILNGTGAQVLEQMNNAFETVASSFTGSSEPKQTYPGMVWIDTSKTNAVKKQRNSDNTDWVILGTFIDGAFINEDRAIIETHTITLGTNWIGTDAPYSQEVEIEGILATDNPIAGLIQSSDYTAAAAQLTDFAKIFRAVTADGKITFFAQESTSTNLTIQIKVIR